MSVSEGEGSPPPAVLGAGGGGGGGASPPVDTSKKTRRVSLSSGANRVTSGGALAGHVTDDPLGPGTTPGLELHTMPAGGGGHGGGDGGHGLHTGGDPADVSFLINENPVEQGTVARVVKLVVLLLMLGCMLQMAEIASATTGTEIEAEKDLEHYGIFFQLFVLVVGMVAGYGLEQYHVTVVAEAGGVLMVGLIAGWLMTKDEETGLADDNAKELEHVATFDVNFFFLFLLPPIILDAGFNMDEMQRRKLFQNIGAVCCLAFGGTLISTIAMACIMHWFGSVAVVTEDAAGGAAFPEGMTWVESLVFGSLISATDPVTVLAIFGKMGADRDLYALVFGESVLNDAVAIVLYKTVAMFNPHTCDTPGYPQCLAGASAGFHALITFCKIFAGSVFVGCFVAAIASLTFKHLDLTHEEFFAMENVLLFVFPYMAWMLAESLELSGIVAILFCGFGMDVYAFINISDETRKVIKKMIKVMAFGCETFVFIYMGVSLSVLPQFSGAVPAIIVAILGMALTRVLNVYPVLSVVNMQRPARRAVKPATMHVTWYSGLRGGIAFALALQAQTQFGCRVPSCNSVQIGPAPAGEEQPAPQHFMPFYQPTAEEWWEAAEFAAATPCGQSNPAPPDFVPTNWYSYNSDWKSHASYQPEGHWQDSPPSCLELYCLAMVGKRECTMQELTDAGPNMEAVAGRQKIFSGGVQPAGSLRGYDFGHLCECRLKGKEQSEGRQLEGQVGKQCRNQKTEEYGECECPRGKEGAGPAILTITLWCVIYCVLALGGGAYKVMSHFGVIGIDKARADRIQKLEEQEDYIIMMSERKKSRWLWVDTHVITPFLTWQGTNQPRDPLLKKAAAAQREAEQRMAAAEGGGGLGAGGLQAVGGASPI